MLFPVSLSERCLGGAVGFRIVLLWPSKLTLSIVSPSSSQDSFHPLPIVWVLILFLNWLVELSTVTLEAFFSLNHSFKVWVPRSWKTWMIALYSKLLAAAIYLLGEFELRRSWCYPPTLPIVERVQTFDIVHTVFHKMWPSAACWKLAQKETVLRRDLDFCSSLSSGMVNISSDAYWEMEPNVICCLLFSLFAVWKSFHVFFFLYYKSQVFRILWNCLNSMIFTELQSRKFLTLPSPPPLL